MQMEMQMQMQMHMHSSITRMMTCTRKARVSVSGKASYNNQAIGVLAKKVESPLLSPSPLVFPSPAKRMSIRVNDKAAKDNFADCTVLFNNLPLENDPEMKKFYKYTSSESKAFKKEEDYSYDSLFRPTPLECEVALKIVTDIAELGIKTFNKTNNTDFECIRVKHSNHKLEHYKVRGLRYFITFIAKEKKGNQKEIIFEAKGYGGGYSRYKPTLEYVQIKKSERKRLLKEAKLACESVEK